MSRIRNALYDMMSSDEPQIVYINIVHNTWHLPI